MPLLRSSCFQLKVCLNNSYHLASWETPKTPSRSRNLTESWNRVTTESLFTSLPSFPNLLFDLHPLDGWKREWFKWSFHADGFSTHGTNKVFQPTHCKWDSCPIAVSTASIALTLKMLALSWPAIINSLW